MGQSRLSRRPTIIAFAASALLSAIATAFAAIQVAGVLQAATDLRAQVANVRTSIAGFDPEVMALAIEQTAEAARDLVTATRSPTWRAVEHLPFAGKAAQAISATGHATLAMASAARPLGGILSDEGPALTRMLALLQATDDLRSLAAASQDAQAVLEPFATTDLPLGLDGPIRSAFDASSTASDALAALVDATGPISGILGMDRSKTWLIMAQNPAEARGSGGLFNAYLIAQVDHGTLQILEAGSRKQLDGEFPRDQQIPYLDSVDMDTASSWGPVLGEWASFNLPRDFPTVANLAAAGMAKRGTPVDGVIAIDPILVQAILAGTGPVEHQGVRIDGSNAAEFFTKGLYEDFPGFRDVKAKDELAMGLTYATIDAALKRPLDLAGLWSQANAAIADGHLKVWSADPAIQAWLQSTPVSGSLLSKADEVVVSFNNGTGGKLDAYAKTEVMTDAATCVKVGEVRTKVRIGNEAPSNLPPYVDVTLDQDGLPDPGAPKGQTLTYVTAYPPLGWRLHTATLDGSPVDPWDIQEAGRQAWLIPVTLGRSQFADIVLTWFADPCPSGPPAT